MTATSASANAFAKRRRQVGRPGNADLLTEDGADGAFERIPHAGNANARLGMNEGSKRRMPGEMSVDGSRASVQIEEPAQPGDELGRSLRQGGRDSDP